MRRTWLFTLMALLLVACMPSSDSLWIDEFETYSHVTQPDVASWWTELAASHFSEVFMPLGMLSAWTGARILGTSEYALRAVNIVWIGLAVLAMALIGQTWKRPLVPLFFAVQPFVWTYANEARPYALQIACGSWMALSIVEFVQGAPCQGWRLHTLAISSLVLLGTSLFGILTVAPLFIILGCYLWRQHRTIRKSGALWLGLLIIIGGALGIYYLQHLRLNAAGARIWSPGISNLAYAFYEFSGFQGMGPPRDELRELARAHSWRVMLQGVGWHAMGMCLLALLLLTFVAGLVRRRRDLTQHPAASLLLGVAASATFITWGISILAHFPFWGRHLAPAFPFYILGLFLGADRAWSQIPWPRQQTLFVSCSLLLLFVSSALLRWSPWHRKDDYRSAARLGTEAAAIGQTVWWSAAPHVTLYYPLPLTWGIAARGQILEVYSLAPDNLATFPRPDLVIYTKQDIFDPDKRLYQYLQQNGYRESFDLKAITLWRPAAKSD